MKTIKTIRLALIAAFMLILYACGSDDYFTIRGKIQGAGSRSVVVTYYSEGGLKQKTVQSVNDEFALRLNSKKPTLLTVAFADGQTIANVVAKDGDEITLEGVMEKLPELKVSGNSESEKVSRWVNENLAPLASGDSEAINASVAKFIGEHKNDVASTILLTTYFRTEGAEHQADSLFSLIAAKARSLEIVQGFNSVLSAQLGAAKSEKVNQMYLYDRSDSLISVDPRRNKLTLLCFVGDNRLARDSISPKLHQLKRRADAERVQPVELSTAADSASWRQSLGRDSVQWPQTWLPGSLSNPSVRKLSVPRTPFFIVADSTGRQIYRGPSIKAAIVEIESRLK